MKDASGSVKTSSGRTLSYDYIRDQFNRNFYGNARATARTLGLPLHLTMAIVGLMSEALFLQVNGS